MVSTMVCAKFCFIIISVFYLCSWLPAKYEQFLMSSSFIFTLPVEESWSPVQYIRRKYELWQQVAWMLQRRLKRTLNKSLKYINFSFFVSPPTGFSGCHRYEAHQRLGLPTIRCKIRHGTKETLRFPFMFWFVTDYISLYADIPTNLFFPFRFLQASPPLSPRAGLTYRAEWYNCSTSILRGFTTSIIIACIHARSWSWSLNQNIRL